MTKVMIPLNIGTFNFDCVVNQTEKPVLLVFGAEWDYKSRKLFKLLELVNPRFDNKILLGKVDYDFASDIFSECRIADLPTMVIYEDGKEFERVVGYTGSEHINRFIYRFFGIVEY